MNAVIAITHDLTPIEAFNVPVDHVEPKPGFNPRIFFRPVPMEELKENIRRRGVVQSIAIRRRTDDPNRYWIIAGERRWRACVELGLLLIPARLFVATEEEAQEIAAAESIRDDLSFGEEALAARRMMIARNGDRAEAARRLGWSPKKLDARLLLSQATQSVLIALAEERIQLGHAELLSALPEATQEGTLAEILKRGISVTELHTKLAAFTLDLATAAFDQAACRNCPHNTTRQASLFEQNVGEGRCTNRPCFQAKTDQHLEELRPALRDRYPSVRSDRDCEPGTWTVLLREDVGSTQFDDGCARCPNFGCILSSRIGEAGKVTEDVCFDLPCHKRKIQAHREATSGPQATAQATPTAPMRTVKQQRSPQEGQAERAESTNRTPAEVVPLSRKLQDRIDAVIRRAASAEIVRDAKMARVYSILALMSELGIMNGAKEGPLERHGIKRPHSGDTRLHLIGTLYQQTIEVLGELVCELAAQVAAHAPPDSSTRSTDYLAGTQRTLAVMRSDLSEHFTVDAEFLSAHSKEQMRALLEEAGFPTHYNRLDQSAFKKLMAGRHADIVKNVMSSGFEFKGFVPKCVRNAPH